MHHAHCFLVFAATLSACDFVTHLGTVKDDARPGDAEPFREHDTGVDGGDAFRADDGGPLDSRAASDGGGDSGDADRDACPSSTGDVSQRWHAIGEGGGSFSVAHANEVWIGSTVSPAYVARHRCEAPDCDANPRAPWTTTRIDAPVVPSSLFAAGTTVYAVKREENYPEVELWRFNGLDWIPHSVPVRGATFRALGVAGIDASNVWVYGEPDIDGEWSTGEHLNAAVWHFAPPVWTPQELDTSRTGILDLSIVNANSMWATATDGYIRRYDGGWRRVLAGCDGPVWASSDDDVFAACRTDPRIVHWNGVEWTTVLHGLEFEDIWGSGPNDVYAVGARGLVAHFDGTTWSTLSDFANLGEDLHGVGGTGSDRVFIFGRATTYLGTGDLGCLLPVGEACGCIIDGICRHAGERHPSATCASCVPERSATDWSADPETCFAEGVCHPTGDRDPSGCSECRPAIDSRHLTPRDNVCAIDGVCIPEGTVRQGGCGECRPSEHADRWSIPASQCMIGTGCLAAGERDSSGCLACDPQTNPTGFTPLSGTEVLSFYHPLAEKTFTMQYDFEGSASLPPNWYAGSVIGNDDWDVVAVGAPRGNALHARERVYGTQTAHIEMFAIPEGKRAVVHLRYRLGCDGSIPCEPNARFHVTPWASLADLELGALIGGPPDEWVEHAIDLSRLAGRGFLEAYFWQYERAYGAAYIDDVTFFVCPAP